MLYTSCTCKFYCVIGLSMRDALRIAKCQLYSGEWVINTSSWCIACIVYYTLTGYAGMSRWKRYQSFGCKEAVRCMTVNDRYRKQLYCAEMHITRTEYTWRTYSSWSYVWQSIFRSCLVVFSAIKPCYSISCLQLSTCSSALSQSFSCCNSCIYTGYCDVSSCSITDIEKISSHICQDANINPT